MAETLILLLWVVAEAALFLGSETDSDIFLLMLKILFLVATAATWPYSQ